MARRSCLALLLLLVHLSIPVATVHALAPADRLDRFRALAATRLAGAQLGDESAPDDAYREIYALFDEEIVESLGSGGVFASIGFLQDRLDAFAETWGATVVRVMRVGPLTVGAFQLSDGPVGNSVRVYGRLREEAALLTTLSREGRPIVYPIAPAAGPLVQFLVVWEAQPSPHGARPLRVELVRQHGDGVRVVWSSTSAFPDGLFVRSWSVRGNELRVQYEMRYPGWTPGCTGQTEQEDVYRLAAAEPGVVRIGRRQVNGWHRDFRDLVTRLFSAISADDRQTLSGLVPDAGLRTRLPRTLRAEPACDATEGASMPERVSVAATAERGPWQLTWERRGTQWRLIQATPIGP